MWPGNRNILSTYERGKKNPNKQNKQYFLILHKCFEAFLSAVP